MLGKPSVIDASMLRFPAARTVSAPGTPFAPKRKPDRSSVELTFRSPGDWISMPGMICKRESP